MSSLNHIEKIKLEKILEMNSGYVLDFSDRTFRDFVIENTDIDVYNFGYEDNGTSKANRLRNFWKKENDFVTAKLLDKLLEYWKTQKIVGLKTPNVQEENLYQECLKIISRLNGQSFSSKNNTHLTQELHDGVFIAARNIINDGKISGPRVDLITESYSGKGEVLGHAQNPQISINHSNIHFGHGDNVGRDKNIDLRQNIPGDNKDTPLWFKWVLGIVAILTFVFGIYTYIKPNWQNIPIVSSSISSLGKSRFSTTTPNLASIFLKTNSMLDLDKENFLKDYKNGPVYALSGIFENINGSGDDYIVRMIVEKNAVGCLFSPESKKDLLLLKKGDEVDFYGIFTGSGLGGYGAVNPWYITDCSLLK